MASEVSPRRIKQFIRHPDRPHVETASTSTNLLKNELLRWHPDKFAVKILPRVREEDRAEVQAALDDVIRELTGMMKSNSGD
jgi:hypothetical protein